MKTSTIWLSPVGATVLAIGFFLPWFQISCQPKPKQPPLVTIQVSGYQMATGTKPQNIQALYDSFFTGFMIKAFEQRIEKKTKKKFQLFPQKWLLWGIVVCCLFMFILGLHIASEGTSFKKKYLGTILLIAIVLFLWSGLLQHMPVGIGERKGQIKLPDSIVFKLGVGGILFLVGYAMMWLGTWLVPNSKKNESKHI